MGDLTPNLSRHEFQCKCGKCDEQSPVDFELVTVIQDSADYFAKKLGLPRVTVVVHSGYRCPWWNGKEGGAKDSYHPKKLAADYSILEVSAKDLYSYLVQKYPSTYGIGEYKSWVHVDTRQLRARWRGI